MKLGLILKNRFLGASHFLRTKYFNLRLGPLALFTPFS